MMASDPTHEQLQMLWADVFNNTFESVRTDIYNLMMDTDVDGKTAKKVMQQAFVTYASKPTPGLKRSLWAD
jgi:hypothetical protein